MPPTDLVVGSRGLLGSAVVRELERRGAHPRTVQVPWDEPERAIAALREAVLALVDAGRPWRVLWCAGAGVIGTTRESLDREVATFGAFLAVLAEVAGRPGAASGALFLTSSAGGVHAGSARPPFTEATTPAPISPYGEAKLAAEQLARAFARDSGVPVAIGRIANLYGPGQDPAKAQGLVSQLCRAHLERRPTSIYVSLDTARDYLFVDDAARLLLRISDRLLEQPAGAVVVKILGSQRATTIAMILGELRRVTKRKPLVVLSVSPLASFQTRDLRFRSEVWADLDVDAGTSLSGGILATLMSAAEARRAPTPHAAGPGV